MTFRYHSTPTGLNPRRGATVSVAAFTAVPAGGVVPFNVVNENILGLYVVGSTLVIPPRMGGVYIMAGQLLFPVNVTGGRTANIQRVTPVGPVTRVIGGDSAGAGQGGTGITGFAPSLCPSVIQDLAVGDIISLLYAQSSGGNLVGCSASFSMYRMAQ